MSVKLSLLNLEKKIEQDIKYVLEFLYRKFQKKPTLAIILVGSKKESQIYVERKIKKAAEMGVDINLLQLKEEEVSKSLLIEIIQSANYDENIHGILLQLPLPERLKNDTFEILNTINPEKDIDGLTSYNSGLLNTSSQINYDQDFIQNILSFLNKNVDLICDENDEKRLEILNTQIFKPSQPFEDFQKNFKYNHSSLGFKKFLLNFGISNPIIPCTPLGVFYLIKLFFNNNLEGRTATIFGDSNLTGKPSLRLLLKNKITTTVCHSKTKNGEFFSQNSDIIILATGRKNFFDEKFFNKNKTQLVLDIGISPLDEGGITGDLCNKIKQNEEFKNLYYTPVPFGIGKMTINSLMFNALMIFISNLIKKKNI